MKPLRIITVFIEPPLPFGDAAARWYYVLLKGLVERGHRVTALATCSRPGDMAEAHALFPKPKYDLRCYPHPHRGGLTAKWRTFREPYSYMFSPELRRALHEEMERDCDVLHLEHLWSGWLGLPFRDRALLNLLYLFSIDQTTRPVTSVGDRLLRGVTCRAERRLLRSFPNIRTLTPRLSDCAQTVAPAARVRTVPLGMDLSLYPFSGEPCEPRPPTVSLIGSFCWQPTFSAAERLITRLWPEIKRRVPNARLHLVGRQAREVLQRFVSHPDISLHDNVPDTRPYFAGTDVMLYAPSAGSGMKVKVLEAFALGTPVVTTWEGVEGIPARDGVHAGIADDDAGLITRCVGLLRDASLRQTLRTVARGLVERHCGPERVLDQLEAVYSELQAARTKAARVQPSDTKVQVHNNVREPSRFAWPRATS